VVGLEVQPPKPKKKPKKIEIKSNVTEKPATTPSPPSELVAMAHSLSADSLLDVGKKPSHPKNLGSNKKSSTPEVTTLDTSDKKPAERQRTPPPPESTKDEGTTPVDKKHLSTNEGSKKKGTPGTTPPARDSPDASEKKVAKSSRKTELQNDLKVTTENTDQQPSPKLSTSGGGSSELGGSGSGDVALPEKKPKKPKKPELDALKESDKSSKKGGDSGKTKK